jgi:hypothetical protein
MLMKTKMIVRSLVSIAFFLLLSACTSVNNQDTRVLNYDKSDKEYISLVAKVKSGQAQASDYDMLIRIFPLSSFYKPKSDSEQSAKLMSQSYMENQQWQLCLNVNNALLDINYTSLTGHYGAAVCAAELSNIVLGKYHNSVLDNFIEAIWRTGNGQSPETPFYIISVNDLYAFIQLNQLVAVGQYLTYVNELPIQAIKVQNPANNRTFTWYFDVTPQFRRGVIDDLEAQ